MGTRLWISVWERGTFSLDLFSGACAWRVEGSWQLPLLSHCAFFVEELGCAVGLVPSYDSSHCHQVCAIDVVEAQKEHRPPVVRYVWKSPTEHGNGVPDGEMMNLTYLGNGTFCMARLQVRPNYGDNMPKLQVW
ncbi:unnamed protein product [Miscanthus lutarioriparius]|uniref:Uncharacterized protein n=1 Tax=Miscanthus lutarioriparius TaxID=422564 RepID=A0A811MGU8_9POAL|nr:unnamed protein product [Miscanthus lutarioriparius]